MKKRLLNEKSVEQLVDEINETLKNVDKEDTPEEEAENDADYGYFEDD